MNRSWAPDSCWCFTLGLHKHINLPVIQQLPRREHGCYSLQLLMRCSKLSWDHMWTGAVEGQSTGTIAHSLFLTSHSCCPACSCAGSMARVWQDGQPGNSAVHQRRAWKLFTCPVSDLHGNTKLDLHIQTRGLTGVFGSRWSSLAFVRIGGHCLRQS